MLINVDAKALEWFAAVYLSQDKVGMKECHDITVDIHGDNQGRLKLPDRLTSKKFLFRLIFGGTAPAYANDPEFKEVGWDTKKWQHAIDNFYGKYEGLNRWHNDLMNSVITSPTHSLTMPTGRIYTYEPYLKREELIWPRTTILNYPVQGLGADLMTIARVLLFTRRMDIQLPVLLLSTVHDSILIDSPKKYVDKTVNMLYNVWNDIPKEFERQFGVAFNIPLRCEVSVGKDWGNMEVVKNAN